ncbi:MAG TPA: hypothetical protein VF691_12905 [Cytophagaceae bacterium]|jgi:cytochrome c
MSKNRLAIAFALYTSFCCGQEIKRPQELWVFRSVLDSRARVITVALHEDLYVAYDGNSGGLIKIWKEGVVLDGAVYTTKHGPQPTSLGKAYSKGIVDEPNWFIYKDDKPVETKVQFRGYTWKNNKVIFHYRLTAVNSVSIDIDETPEYTFNTKDNKIGLDRRFMIKDMPAGYTVGLKVYSENMVKKTDFATDGRFVTEARTERFLPSGPVYDLKGTLFFKSNTESKLVTFYDPNAVK